MPAGADRVLTNRALCRATLARQLLLERSPRTPLDAVQHLVGLQAQNPLDPYLGLWSRLDDFDPHGVGALVERRELVRMVVMRGTIHLLTADDALAIRPLVQPVLDAELARHSEFASHLMGLDLTPVLSFAATLMAAEPRTGPRLRDALAAEFPDLHAPALAYACRCRLPLVQVPPRGVWGARGQVTSTTAEAWLGRPLDADASLDGIVLRYLAAFGPATTGDVAAWSRLTGLGEVVDRLRPQLRVFQGERGQELLDLPDAPRPDEETPAPVRFLPEYDNVLLSHSDRARFVPDDSRAFLGRAHGPFKGSVLVGGTVRGIWHSERDLPGARTTLVVEHDRLPRRACVDLEREGDRMARFWFADGSDHDVRLVPTT
jgi:hypothetical protein